MDARAPKKPRYRVEKRQGRTIIHMPVHRTPGHIFRTAFFAVFMALGGGFAVLLSIAGPRQEWFYTVWLSLWGVAMAGIVLYLFYTLFGRDRLVVRPGEVARVRSLFGLPFRQKFTPEEARAFRYTPNDLNVRYGSGMHRRPISALVLSSRDRYVSITRSLTQAEADIIMATIHSGLGTVWRGR